VLWLRITAWRSRAAPEFTFLHIQTIAAHINHAAIIGFTYNPLFVFCLQIKMGDEMSEGIESDGQIACDSCEKNAPVRERGLSVSQQFYNDRPVTTDEGSFIGAMIGLYIL
jgi:hypothetical protein